jgi:hypothetical protein
MARADDVLGSRVVAHGPGYYGVPTWRRMAFNRVAPLEPSQRIERLAERPLSRSESRRGESRCEHLRIHSTVQERRPKR